MTKTSAVLLFAAIWLHSFAVLANHITQVEGKFECPELNNQQECAIKYEEEFLRGNKDIASREGRGWKVRLLNGQDFRIADENERYNLLELAGGGRFLVIRQQFHEGNTWHLLDRKIGVLTAIGGYPLFSSSETKFVAASEDLDAQYSDTVLDIYAVDANGISQEFRGVANPGAKWGPRKVRWRSNTVIDFSQTFLSPTSAAGYEEMPASIELTVSGWALKLPR